MSTLLGTLWDCSWELFENIVGTLWELNGNAMGTLWEHYRNSMGTLYRSIVFIVQMQHIIHHTYLVLYSPIPTYCILQWEANYLSQHSTCILFIHFFLDNDYGTIIS
jgi:hypothetical protein